MSILYLVLIGLFLTSVLFDAALISKLISVVTLLALIASFPSARWVSRFMSLVFLVGGTATLLSVSAGAESMLFGFGEMVYIVTLFSLLPVLSIPIRLFHYDQAVSRFFNAFSATTNKAYFGILSVSYFLGSFLNLGTVPLVYRTVEQSVADLGIENSQKFISISLTQGFIGPLVWTPFSGVLGVTLAVFSTSWLAILPVLLSVGVLSVALSAVAFFVFQARGFRHAAGSNVPDLHHTDAQRLTQRVEWSTIRPLLELFCIVLGFIMAVLFLEFRFQAGLVITIIFTTGPFTILWIFIKGGARKLPQALREHFQGHFRSMAGTYLVFLSAGYFLNSFAMSGYNDLIAEASRNVIYFVGTEYFVLLFPLIVVLLAFLAIHPIVFLILISGALSSEVVGLSAEGMAVTFLAGGVLNFIISPYSGTVGLLRQMTSLSGGQIIMANMPTALMTYLAFVFVIFHSYL